MVNELMLQKNSDIIDALVQWRSLTIDNLKRLINSNEGEAAFRQKIIRMEKAGLLKSRIQRRVNKIVYPSEALLMRLGIESFNEDNVRHDAIVSMVLSNLLSFTKVASAKLPHEYKTKKTWKHYAIEPDAIIEITDQGNIYIVAVEVELWRKERKRVFDKLMDYAKAYEYSNVIYFFGDRASFNSYIKRLEELLSDQKVKHLHEDLSQKIILVFNDSITKRVTELKNSDVYHMGKIKKLGDVLS